MSLLLKKIAMDDSEGTDANEVIDRLWMGGKPPVGPGLSRHVDCLVLSACDFQPSAEHFPDVEVLHAPMHDDHVQMWPGDKDRALNAAIQVARWHKAGKRVLVTCWAGRNRSGFITALSLMLLKKLNPDQAVGLIRAARSENAMRNPHFNHLLVVIYAALLTKKRQP